MASMSNADLAFLVGGAYGAFAHKGKGSKWIKPLGFFLLGTVAQSQGMMAEIRAAINQAGK